MKSYKQIMMGLVIIFSLITIPTMVAHADEGIVTKDFSVEDNNGKVLKKYKANEDIHIKKEDSKNYYVEISNEIYQIEKINILKTMKDEEEFSTIKEDNVTLKASPDLFGEIIHSISKGEKVYRIQEAEEKNGFVKVKTSQAIEGWVLNSTLNPNIRKTPVKTKAFIKDDSQRDLSLEYGDILLIVGFENNKYKALVDNKPVLVDKSAVTFTEPKKRVVRPVLSSRSEKAVTHNDSLSERLINEAYNYKGVPYVWGGTTPNGFDCSGFTQYVSNKVGVSLPRVTSDQARLGKYVERSNLMKGDYIFFETYKAGPSHIGIYIGNGKFIHAGGDRVQISSLNESYYSQRYLYAKRMF